MDLLLWKKNKIQNKHRSVSDRVDVVEIVEIDDEELYVPDDVLEETGAARYQMFPKKIKITLSVRIAKIYERMKTSE
jgi:hypothetical protein